VVSLVTELRKRKRGNRWTRFATGAASVGKLNLGVSGWASTRNLKQKRVTGHNCPLSTAAIEALKKDDNGWMMW